MVGIEEFSARRKARIIDPCTCLRCWHNGFNLSPFVVVAMDFEPKSPTYLDPTNFSYDSLSALDPFVQYPHSPFVGIPMGLPGPSNSPRINFDSLNLASNLTDYTYPTGAYTTTASSARPYTPPDGAGISPAGLYNLSAGEMSSDGAPSGRRGSRGSGTNSPASSQGVSYAATVPRSHRFNPIATPASRRAPKRKQSRDVDSDDEDDDFQPTASASANPDSRRETIRKQRIESEQRRRDELREGYARLRETLPTSNQKASKVSLLDRATTHIRYLDTVRDQLEARLKAAESEVHRLRSVNEALMLGTAEQRHAAAAAAVAAVQATSTY